MERYGLYTFALICAAVTLLCTGCGKKFTPNGYKDQVVKIVDGKTIELACGLHVRLLGVTETELGRNYLEKHVKGETVVLIRDVGSNTPRTEYKGMPKQISAYVKVEGALISVNGNMLLSEYCNFNALNCKDSADVFVEYTKHRHDGKTYTPEELLTRIKPATFQIRHSDGSIGTGFFINETGLAVTNNHVLSDVNNVVCIFFGENGELNTSNYRSVERILLSCDDEKIDFSVFQVRLNPNEKTAYIPLAREKQKEGIEVWKLGCPVGLNANFQGGILSNYNELEDDYGNKYYYLAHSCGSNNGDSGGPVVDNHAEAVGINQSIQFNTYLSKITGSAQKAEGIAYAVDAVTIRRLMNENHIEYHK